VENKGELERRRGCEEKATVNCFTKGKIGGEPVHVAQLRRVDCALRMTLEEVRERIRERTAPTRNSGKITFYEWRQWCTS